MQLGSHYAPRRHSHPVEYVSYSGLDLQAETAMTHQLYCILHNAQQRTRPGPVAQPSVAFFPNSRLSLHPIIPCPHRGFVPQSGSTAEASWTVTDFRLAGYLAAPSQCESSPFRGWLLLIHRCYMAQRLHG